MANYNLFDAASLVMIPTGTKDGKLYSIKPVPVYGSELIALSANRDFSSNTGFWTFESPQVTYGTGKVDFNTSLTNYGFYKTSFLVPNKSYIATFDIVNYTSGAVHVNGGGLVYGSVNSNGTHRISLNSNANGTFAIQSDSGGAVLLIDNISIKEILVGDGDFDFSRGSNLSATRVDAAGLIEKGRENLLLQSNQFDTTWTTSSSASITGGQADKDGGTSAWKLQAITASTAYVRQLIDASSNVSTFSFYAKAGTSNWTFVNCVNVTGFFDLANGAVGALGGGSNVVDASITSVGGGWYRVSLTGLGMTQQRIYTASANGNSVSAVGDNIYIQDAQLEVGLVATAVIETTTTTGTAGILENTPRFDYSNGASCPSLLLEPSRTSLIKYSEYFGSSEWVKNSINLTTNNATSPEGIQNATKIAATTISSDFRTQNMTIQSGVEYTWSVYAKNAGNRYFRMTAWTADDPVTTFDLDAIAIFSENGPAHTSTIEDAGNGWRKLTITRVSTSAVAWHRFKGTNEPASANGVDGVLIYGAQLEQGSYPTSYIPNHSGGTETRSADACGGAGDANTFNSTEGVLYAEAKTFSITGSAGLISLSNGTTSNRVTIELDGANIKVRFVVGGSSIGIFNYAINIKETLKIAAKYKANDFALWVNGTERVAITSGSSFSNNTLSELSFDRGDGNEIFLGNVKQVITFNTALTDTELATLTTL